MFTGLGMIQIQPDLDDFLFGDGAAIEWEADWAQSLGCLSKIFIRELEDGRELALAKLMERASFTDIQHKQVEKRMTKEKWQ